MIKKTFLVVVIISTIFGCSSFPYLGSGYKLDYNASNDIYLLDSNNTVIVDGHILKYGFNSNFIVLEQKPRDIILKDTYDNQKMNLKMRENIFNDSPIRLFWIVNKINNRIYGPFNKGEYLRNRERLCIPKELELKD